MKSNRNYGKRLRSLMPGMLLCVAVWSAPALAFATDNWTCANGLFDQNWSDPKNWSQGVPTASSDVSIPNATSTCVVNLNGSGNVRNLGILAGGEVIVGDGSSLTINGASITND